MEPIIVTGIDDSVPLMAEEQFCPAIPVSTYRDVEDALRSAPTAPSLRLSGGSVWSGDVAKATDLARRIQTPARCSSTRTVPRALTAAAPYGGIKQSGIGRRAGIDGVREYMQIQTLTTFKD